MIKILETPIRKLLIAYAKFISHQNILQQAKQGDSAAQCLLGDSYLYGKGITKDYKKAFVWYQKSALQENPYGQNSLGWMYEQGIGFTKNLAEAFTWYELAAKQEMPSAQYNVGISMQMVGG